MEKATIESASSHEIKKKNQNLEDKHFEISHVRVQVIEGGNTKAGRDFSDFPLCSGLRASSNSAHLILPSGDSTVTSQQVLV